VIRKALWVCLLLVAVAASAQLASQPKRYREGDFPTGRDLQANIEWLWDQTTLASEALQPQITSNTLNIAVNTAAIATLTATMQTIDVVANIAKTNTGSASQLFTWESNGLGYYEPIAGEGVYRYITEYAYTGAGAYRGGGRVEGVIAYSPGSGTYVIGDPVSFFWDLPGSGLITVVATHSSVPASGSVRFGLIASFPSSISFEATARTRFVGVTL